MSITNPHKSALYTDLDPSRRMTECMDPKIVEIESDLTSGIDSMALTTVASRNAISLANACASGSPKDTDSLVPLSSPAGRLPFDVLEHIFLACMDTFHPSITNPRHPSVTLSRVCTSWRGTALQCHALWAKPRMVFPGPELGIVYTPRWHQSMAKLGKALEVWVGRSGSLPMAILVDTCAAQALVSLSSEEYKAHLTLINAIKRSSTRWSELVLDIVLGPKSDVLLELMKLTPSSVPLLHTISLKVSNQLFEWKSPDHDNLQGLLSTSGIFLAPSLRSVTLSGRCGVTASTAVHLWPPLTHLHVFCKYPAGVSNTSVFDFFRYLQAIPTLEDVSTLIQGQNVNTDPRPLTFLNLKRLTIMGACVPQGLGPFLNLPALQDLHLRVGDAPYGGDARIVEFILHFSPQLIALTFLPEAVPANSLGKVFENLPRVETLVLESRRSEAHPLRSKKCPGIDYHVLRELCVAGKGAVGVAGGARPRCPQLRLLDLNMSSDIYSDGAVEQALVVFVASRKLRRFSGDEINRLQCVSIAYQQRQRFAKAEVVKALEKLGVSGFDLRTSAQCPLPHDHARRSGLDARRSYI